MEEVADDPIDDVNVAYTLHYYAATHKEGLRNKAQTAIDRNVPLFVTEFGICEADGDGNLDFEESRKWWDFLAENDISWCNWSVVDKVEAASALTSGSPSNGQWTNANYTTSGAFVRDELRRTHELPTYENTLSIQFNNPEIIQSDSDFQFDISVFNADTLIADSLVSYTIEMSNGGSVSDSGLFLPNGETGNMKLFITAVYDTLITTLIADIIITDVHPGNIDNKDNKTFLALVKDDTYTFAPSLAYGGTKSTTAPHEGDTLMMNNQAYVWSVINEPSGIVSQSDSRVRSFISLYVINPVERVTKISRGGIGFGQIHLNGSLVGFGNFNLPKGENVLFIEYTGATTDTSAFDFAFMTPKEIRCLTLPTH